LVLLGVLLAVGAFALNSDTSDGHCSDISPVNTTEWKKWAQCRAKFAGSALTSNHGMNALFFAIGALVIVGYIYFIFYTAVGMVILPLNMIRSRGKISEEETEELTRSKTVSAEQTRSIKSKYSGAQKKMTARDRRLLRQAEEDSRVTAKAEERVAEVVGGACGKLGACCRPFTFMFGVLFFILSLFIAICLTMTSGSKLYQIKHNMNDPDHDPKVWNWKTGYSKTSDTMFNPVDWIFTHAAGIFPIDYILVTLIVYYFVVATMTGVKELGVRFCHLKMYKIRANRTVPQGLLMLAFILVFVILALNVILMTLSPQYVSFGNQKYTPGIESDFANPKAPCVGFTEYPKNEEWCNSNAPPYQVLLQYPKNCESAQCKLFQFDVPLSSNFSRTGTSESDWDYTTGCTNIIKQFASFQPKAIVQCGGNSSSSSEAYDAVVNYNFTSCSVITPCVETRLSALLNAFFYNYWFLGMIYYWANWGFLVVFYASLVYCTCKRRRSIYQSMVNDVQTDLIDSDDDDMTPFKPSWA